MNTTARAVRNAWHRLSTLPGGRHLFGLVLGRMVPYSGSIRPLVLELEPGRATVSMADRRRLRNHYGSLHAIALANLGELASGLAMTLALPAGVRGIPTAVEVEYQKKARGTITARGHGSPPQVVHEPLDAYATATLDDAAGDTVARVRVRWRLSPEPD